MTSVIVADDHPFLCSGVSAVLKGAGLDVVATAADGESALSEIARHDPDVVILDVTMPVKDGISTLTSLREKGDARPVILLTAQINDKALVAAVRARVDGIVLKQGAEDSLIDAVHRVARGERVISPDLLERALDASMSVPAANPLEVLTPREIDIARAVAHGMRNREIAEKLGMTEGSIKVYLHRIYDKLNVENRTGLAILVRDTGAHLN